MTPLIRDMKRSQVTQPPGAPSPRSTVARPAEPLLDVTARHRLPDHVVVRSLVLETVVLNLRTGQYHGLNPTAGRVLEMLGSGLTVAQISERLASEARHPLDEVTRAVCKTCAALLARGLLEPEARLRS
jgi:hypothetical protein